MIFKSKPLCHRDRYNDYVRTSSLAHLLGMVGLWLSSTTTFFMSSNDGSDGTTPQ